MTDDLGRAVWVTLTNPREGARRVFGWGLGWTQLALVLATGIVLSLLISALVELIGDPGDVAEEPGMMVLAPGPVIFHLAWVLFVGAVILWVGRLFGGRGGPLEVATAVAWVSLVEPLLFGLLLVVVLLIKGLVTLLAIAVSLWSLWILSCFIARAHGFPSAFRVMVASIGILIGFAILLTILLVAVGVQPPGASHV